MPDSAQRSARIVLITLPDLDAGRRMARALVEERLAACANLLPVSASIYRWQGEVQEDPEVLAIVKTRVERLAALETRVGELHPYDVPEIVTLAPERVEEPYLPRLLEATSG